MGVAEMAGVNLATFQPLNEQIEPIMAGQLKAAFGFVEQIATMDVSNDTELSKAIFACDELARVMRSAPVGPARESLQPLAARLVEASNRMIANFRAKEARRKESRKGRRKVGSYHADDRPIFKPARVDPVQQHAAQ